MKDWYYLAPDSRALWVAYEERRRRLHCWWNNAELYRSLVL